MKKILFILLLALVQSAQAADFIFNVPLKLEQIPRGIPQAKVICEVFAADDIKPIASGYAIHSINTQRGYLNKNIAVRVNFHTMPQPADRYRCHLQLLLPWATPSWQTPAQDAPFQVLQPEENSSLQSEASGLIKQPNSSR